MDRYDLSIFFFRRTAVPVLLLGLGGLSACQTQPWRVTQRERDLAAAGFMVRQDNTPECQQARSRLRPNHFARCVHDDTVHYDYADPVVCKCFYVGSQQAYNQFKLHEEQQRIAQLMTARAQSYSGKAWNWGTWGPWSPGYDSDLDPSVENE